MGGFGVIISQTINTTPSAQRQISFSKQAARLQSVSIKEVYNQSTSVYSGAVPNSPNNRNDGLLPNNISLTPTNDSEAIAHIIEQWIASRESGPITHHVNQTGDARYCGINLISSSQFDTPRSTLLLGNDISISSPQTPPHLQYSFTWAWDGSVHHPPSMLSHEAILDACVAKIIENLVNTPDTQDREQLLEQITTSVSHAVHDVLRTIQATYAFFLTFRIHSSPWAILEGESISVTVFGRDVIGRRSLVMRLFHATPPTQQVGGVVDSEHSTPHQQTHNGLVISTLPLHLDDLPGGHSPSPSELIMATNTDTTTSDVPDSPKDSSPSQPSPSKQLLLHHPDWVEVGCGGIYSITSTTTHSTLQFLPWNFSIIPSDTDRIPQSLLFPRYHNPVPIHQLHPLPPQLQQAADYLPLAPKLLLYRLSEAVRRQLLSLPDYSTFLATVQDKTQPGAFNSASEGSEDPYRLSSPARVGVMFSGGVDCTVVAAIAHLYVPSDEPIDLINVAFRGSTDDAFIDQAAADRAASINSLAQLQAFAPHRCWRLIKTNISIDDLETHSAVVSSLIAPHDTTMDFNIGSILYFGSRGAGVIHPHAFYQSNDTAYEVTAHADKTRIIDGKVIAASVRYVDLSKPSSPVVGDGSTTCLTQKQKQQLRKEEMLQRQAIPVPITRELLFKTKHSKEELKVLRQCLGEERRLESTVGRVVKQLLIEGGVVTKETTTRKDFDITEFAVPPPHDGEPPVMGGLRQTLAQCSLTLRQYQDDHVDALYIAKAILEKHPLRDEDASEKLAREQQAVSVITTTTSSNGEDVAKPPHIPFQSHAMLLLMGSGADEQMAGYGRHRTAYRNALRHLMPMSLHSDDVIGIHQREVELYGKSSVDISTTPGASSSSPSPSSSSSTDIPPPSVTSSSTANKPEQAEHTTPVNDDDDTNDANQWLAHIAMDVDNFKSVLNKYQREYNNCRIEELPFQTRQTLQQLAMFHDIQKDVLRIWFRNLGRDDRVLSFWGRQCGIPFLDEDLMWLLSRFRPDHYEPYTPLLAYYHQLVSSPSTPSTTDTEPTGTGADVDITTIDEQLLYFPLSSLCDMGYPQGSGDKRILRLIAHELNLTKAATLQKRAMQFGSRIANRLVSGVQRLREIERVRDLVNQQFLTSDQVIPTSSPR